MNDNKEFAIIFAIGKRNEDDSKVELLPVDFVEGNYDDMCSKFVSDSAEYDHFTEMNNLIGFGFNYPIVKYLNKYPNLPYNEFRKEYLHKLLEYEFYLYYFDEVGYYIEIYENNKFKLKITDIYIDEFNNQLLKYDLMQEKIKKNKYNDYDIIIPNPKEKKQEEKKIILNGLYDELKTNIIGQDDQLKLIVGTIWKNYSSNMRTTNMLFLGPTGVGKTETCRIISEYMKVPSIIVSANQYSRVGYVGDNTKNILKELMEVSNGKVEDAERGIVFIDELDKIASSTVNEKSGVATSAVQNELLKIIEDGTFTIDGVQISTKNITFIAAGAFDGINKSGTKHLGFDHDITNYENMPYSKIGVSELENYGISSQLLGRLPILVHYNSLTEKDYFNIMKEAKNSYLNSIIELYKNNGVNLIIPDSVILEMAKRIKKLDKGARGIETITNVLISELNFIMSQGYNIFKTIELTPETLDNPKKYILR